MTPHYFDRFDRQNDPDLQRTAPLPAQAQPATEREEDTMKARKLAAPLNTRYIVHDGGETINIPSDRVLKEGERAVPMDEWDALESIRNRLMMWHINLVNTDVVLFEKTSKIRTIRSQRAAEGGGQ